jgi:hypothetical protein
VVGESVPRRVVSVLGPAGCAAGPEKAESFWISTVRTGGRGRPEETLGSIGADFDVIRERAQ